MLENIEAIIRFFRDYLYRYSFFVEGDYYLNMWVKYTNTTLEVFFLGVAAVIFIYLAGSGENKVSGFFSSLAIIALLNSMGTIYEIVCGRYIFQQVLIDQGNVFELAVNPISGAVLVLVIYSCYTGCMGNAFCLGMITYAITLLMFNVFANNYSIEIIIFLIVSHYPRIDLYADDKDNIFLFKSYNFQFIFPDI